MPKKTSSPPSEYDIVQSFFKACASGHSKVAHQILQHHPASLQIIQVGISVALSKKKTNVIRTLVRLGKNEEETDRLQEHAWQMSVKHRQNDVLLDFLKDPLNAGEPPRHLAQLMCACHLTAPRAIWDALLAHPASRFDPLTPDHVLRLVKSKVAQEALEALFVAPDPLWLPPAHFVHIPLSVFEAMAQRLSSDQMSRYFHHLPPSHQTILSGPPHASYPVLQAQHQKHEWAEKFVHPHAPSASTSRKI